MAITLTSLSQVYDLGFDEIIDVRSPDEWAEDHIPGAINLPVLDNAERAEVGTLYAQVNPFTARKVGGALVAQNAAKHLQGPLAEKTGAWRPLVYCWRGGQRSGSFASILSQIGWRAELVAGGYKTYRSLVVAQLYDLPVVSPVVVLGGNTGTAKTEVLAHLAAQGVQVIDLEGLARHRGSLFGAMAGGQPSQKGFESALAQALVQLDPTRPVVVEAESSKVGDCRLPPMLWKAMQAAPRVVIAAPVAARADYLMRAYADLIEDRARLEAIIASLRGAHPAEVVQGWLALVAQGDYRSLAADLMVQHYDPRYAKHRDRVTAQLVEVNASGLAESDMPHLAASVAQAVARLAV